jgi:chemotaxis protein histidine kinase CheA
MQGGQGSTSTSAAEVTEAANEEQQQLSEQANNMGCDGEEISTAEPASAPVQVNSEAVAGEEDPASSSSSAATDDSEGDSAPDVWDLFLIDQANQPAPPAATGVDAAPHTPLAGNTLPSAGSDHLLEATEAAAGEEAQAATTPDQATGGSEPATGAEQAEQAVHTEADHVMTDAAAATEAATAAAAAAAADTQTSSAASEPAPGAEEAPSVGVAAAASTSSEGANTCAVCFNNIATEPFGCGNGHMYCQQCIRSEIGMWEQRGVREGVARCPLCRVYVSFDLDTLQPERVVRSAAVRAGQNMQNGMQEEEEEVEVQQQQLQQHSGDRRRRVRSVFDALVSSNGRNVRRRVMNAQQEAFVGALMEHGAFMLDLMENEPLTADNMSVAVASYRIEVSRMFE